MGGHVGEPIDAGGLVGRVGWEVCNQEVTPDPSFEGRFSVGSFSIFVSVVLINRRAASISEGLGRTSLCDDGLRLSA